MSMPLRTGTHARALTSGERGRWMADARMSILRSGDARLSIDIQGTGADAEMADAGMSIPRSGDARLGIDIQDRC